jgi:hypothetical protein
MGQSSRGGDLFIVDMRPIEFGSPSERAGHDALARQVALILFAQRADPSADTGALEGEMDQRVYRLSAVTPDEVRLVKEAAK